MYLFGFASVFRNIRRSGKHLQRGIANHGAPLCSVKPHDQAEGFRRTTHRTPGDPDAVGISEARSTVMIFKLFRGNDIFFQGGRVRRIASVAVE